MDNKFDSMPPEAKTVIRILSKNGMFPFNEETKNKGKSVENPIVIGVADGHVQSEYLVSEFLLHGTEHKFQFKVCVENEGHIIDKLIYDVIRKDGTTYQEEFCYDITEGYNNPPQEYLDLLKKKDFASEQASTPRLEEQDNSNNLPTDEVEKENTSSNEKPEYHTILKVILILMIVTSIIQMFSKLFTNMIMDSFEWGLINFGLEVINLVAFFLILNKKLAGVIIFYAMMIFNMIWNNYAGTIDMTTVYTSCMFRIGVISLLLLISKNGISGWNILTGNYQNKNTDNDEQP